MPAKRTKHPTTPVTLEMTPMIDVVFLLLVFFIVSMKFRVAEGLLEARLPPDAGQHRSNQRHDLEAVRLRLRLTEATPASLMQLSRRGRPLPEAAMTADSRFRVQFMVGETPVLTLDQRTHLIDGQPRTTVRWTARSRAASGPEPLQARLRDINRQDPDLPLLIAPDRGVPYSALVAALEAGRRAGFSDIRFAGDTRPQR